MQFELLVRRFRCRSHDCGQRIFCERFTDPAIHARRTRRQAQALVSLWVELGGRAGARVAASLKLLAGRTTLLNILRAKPIPTTGKPRLIGVDDFAFKRGHTYGTVIVNLETHKPIDVLPDPQAST